ncbi:glycosyltransferase family 2 protein [Priestia endophytica]|uniref:glycosyltransferase family 2 protein n=1 Tax=Priestia endophytica TaxID=135735 RepID=UPI001558D81F|nr:glycosyltransferase [Priestia endophytica]
MGNLVSVIIPTYKRPFEVLVKAIDSVLKQTHSNFELIIVDDSPEGDQNRIEIEKKITTISDNRVKYIKHAYNQGACKARNTGIEVAKGEYIAFLDDDDTWLPNKLELQLDKFSDKSVGLVYCDAYIVTLKENKEVKRVTREKRKSGFMYEELILDNFIGSTSFVMLRKDVLDEVGLFDVKLKSAQDYELWLRISNKYKIDCVELPLVTYYIHEGERISTNVDYKIQGFERLNDLNMKYLEKNPKALCVRRLNVVPFYSTKYGWKIALLKWFKAVKEYPFYIKSVKYLLKIFIKRA